MADERGASSSLFERLVSGLARTRAELTDRIGQLFRGPVTAAATLEALEELLLGADLGPETVERIVASLRRDLGRRALADAQQVQAAVKAELLAVLRAVPPYSPDADPVDPPRVFLFLGVNGSGKTTTVGKLAKRLRDAGGKVVLAGADTFRAAAIEQLKQWGERVGADVVCHREGSDPPAVVFDALQAALARGATHLLIDTAGRLHTKRNLMEELKKIQRVVTRQIPRAPHDRLMVLDATSGLNAVVQAREFHAAVGLTGLVLTKLDGTAKGGGVVAIAHELRVPIAFVGIGEGLDDLQPFSPETFTDALFTAS
jgi:fused signal recognition particle receptor